MSPIVRHGRQSERGQVVILVVLVLAIFLLGFVGLATDYSTFWFERQSIQGAADATCQSTAMDLLLSAVGEPTGKANFTLGTAFTCNSAPTAAPCVIAKYNGYDGTLTGNTVSVSFPLPPGWRNGSLRQAGHHPASTGIFYPATHIA